MRRDGKLILHPADNVVVAIAHDDPMRGHKFARRPIASGEAIIKFGEPIGRASAAIQEGDHIHVHNMAPARVQAAPDDAATCLTNPKAGGNPTFEGYDRGNGRFGTRNHLLVLTTVNCSASVARLIARNARNEGLGAGLDGISALTHHGGCGIGATSEGGKNLRRTLAGYAAHPNAGGALIVGLGCEVNQIDDLLGLPGFTSNNRIRRLVIQEEGGSMSTVEHGVGLLAELAEEARADHRTTAPASALTIALQCGGSDGYSAITANPALGRASDAVVAHGGTVILAETPEMHGAEHLLVRRAVSRQVASSLLDRLQWWKSYCEPEDNPSPGNKRGGLTTIAEKSLGAITKAGTSPLVDVIRYAEPVRRRGFTIMDSPGYDPCAVTGEIASGATVVCFTTGRGSVSGFIPAPCVKVSTNTALFDRMEGDIDLDAGTIATGLETVEEVGSSLFDLLLATASGATTASERLGFGEEEFVPWQMGVVT
jgi:altronate dehydratase